MARPIDTQNAELGSPEWWLARLSRRLTERTRRLRIYDDYYRGEHRLKFATRKLLDAFGETFRNLHFNYCGVVVDALVERLEVQGFRFGTDEAAAKEAWRIWQANKLDAHFARGIRVGLTKGEFSLAVWVDADGEPTISVEDPFEVIVAADPASGERRAALKRWQDPDTLRTHATVYLPDATYKYQSSASRLVTGGSWQRRIVEGEEWPLPNLIEIVPIVPVPNKPSLSGVGESELKDIVPIQDTINKNIINMMLAGEFSAFRQKYATNIVLEVDPDTGKPIEPWQIATDKLLTAPPPEEPGDPETRFGEFDQTDLSGYIGAHETSVQSMATISRTPPHYFLGASGVFPSGESLRSAETGLTKKARDRARDDSEPVEEAMRLAFLLKSHQEDLDDERSEQLRTWAAVTDSETLWVDPESKTESEHVDALVKLTALGIPGKALWPRAGFTPQEIERIEAMGHEPTSGSVSIDTTGGPVDNG